MSDLFIGIMSGTSLDGIDALLGRFAPDMAPEVRGFVHQEFDPALRAELLALNQLGDNELHRSALAANGVARAYALACSELLNQAGCTPAEVRAIGAHGQTVRHRPLEFDGCGYTIQLLNGALLAELSGIATVCDLRSRDLAAGGQGAPLVPAFHRGQFGRSDRDVAVLNIGGISNVSLLAATGDTGGFDCGPGNCLMDLWIQRHQGQAFDTDGAWARQGQVLPELLQAMLADPFFALPPPRSTGRDLFNSDWLERLLQIHARGAAAVDVQATLLELSVTSIVHSLREHAPHTEALLVCGGGALNSHLLHRLAAQLPGMSVESTERHGLAPMQVEAAAFAWLAMRHLHGLAGNLAAVTGAAGPRVLGALHPA